MSIETQPDEITLVLVEAVLMPNGEVLCQGKTLGWFKDVKKHLRFLPAADGGVIEGTNRTTNGSIGQP